MTTTMMSILVLIMIILILIGIMIITREDTTIDLDGPGPLPPFSVTCYRSSKGFVTAVRLTFSLSTLSGHNSQVNIGTFILGTIIIFKIFFSIITATQNKGIKSPFDMPC